MQLKMDFRTFFESQEEQENIAQTLSKLPVSHAKLVKNYQWKFHAGNTLNNDNQHVGYVDANNKEIAVAAPWFHSREFVVLHELGHRVFEQLSAEIKANWSRFCSDESPEESFCMFYATAYCKNPPIKYFEPDKIKFIRSLNV